MRERRSKENKIKDQGKGRGKSKGTPGQVDVKDHASERKLVKQVELMLNY